MCLVHPHQHYKQQSVAWLGFADNVFPAELFADFVGSNRSMNDATQGTATLNLSKISPAELNNIVCLKFVPGREALASPKQLNIQPWELQLTHGN